MMQQCRGTQRFISLKLSARCRRGNIDCLPAGRDRSLLGATATFPSYRLPNPTWSVQDLELSKQHEPISQIELERLAKRAVLDLNQLDESTRNQLCQDLGNMMHMIEQVLSFQHNDEHVVESVIYDAPRGVTAAPLRKDSDNDGDTVEDYKQVWESFLKPQTTKIGAHDYFSIETDRKNKES